MAGNPQQRKPITAAPLTTTNIMITNTKTSCFLVLRGTFHPIAERVYIFISGYMPTNKVSNAYDSMTQRSVVENTYTYGQVSK
jgi:hypothetical protein